MIDILFAMALTLTMLPLGFFWPTCSCCVCTSFYNAAFTSGSLGTNFDDIAGTWTYSSSQLRTSDDDAIVMCTIPSNQPTGSVRVSVAMNRASGALAANESIIVIGAYVDSSNYLKGRMVRSGTLYHELELISVVGGVETVLESRTVYNGGFNGNIPITFRLSYDSGEARFCHTFPGVGASVQASYTPASGGLYAGFGTDSIDVEARFSSFVFTEDDSVSAQCTSCAACNCPANVVTTTECPCEIQAEITGMADSACTDCNRFNGTFIFAHGTDTTCQYFAYIDPLPTCGGFFNNPFILTLNDFSGPTWRVWIRRLGDGVVANDMFSESQSSEIDCNFASFNVSPNVTYIQCDATVATCELTAL